LHQEASANEKKREEGYIIELQINPERSDLAKFDVFPSYEYEFGGESSDAEP